MEKKPKAEPRAKQSSLPPKEFRKPLGIKPPRDKNVSKDNSKEQKKNSPTFKYRRRGE